MRYRSIKKIKNQLEKKRNPCFAFLTRKKNAVAQLDHVSDMRIKLIAADSTTIGIGRSDELRLVIFNCTVSPTLNRRRIDPEIPSQLGLFALPKAGGILN